MISFGALVQVFQKRSISEGNLRPGNTLETDLGVIPCKGVPGKLSATKSSRHRRPHVTLSCSSSLLSLSPPWSASHHLARRQHAQTVFSIFHNLARQSPKASRQHLVVPTRKQRLRDLQLPRWATGRDNASLVQGTRKLCSSPLRGAWSVRPLAAWSVVCSSPGRAPLLSRADGKVYKGLSTLREQGWRDQPGAGEEPAGREEECTACRSLFYSVSQQMAVKEHARLEGIASGYLFILYVASICHVDRTIPVAKQNIYP